MKKLSTNIITENGDVKKITVFVEDETAAVLAHCDEEIRHLYILEEHEAQNLTRKETRRRISYESITEKVPNIVKSKYINLSSAPFTTMRHDAPTSRSHS